MSDAPKLRKCTKCKVDKAPDEFLAVAKGWKIRWCNTCSTDGMRKYWKARSAVKDPKQIALDARE